jgi:uncharacterized protein DUF4265
VSVAPERTTIKLMAGKKSSGAPVYEEVLVDPLGDGLHRLVASPGLVLGVAAGDHIAVSGEGRFEVVSRGGNVAVQLYADPNIGADVSPLTSALANLGGRLDGHEKNLWVFTIPVSAGFPAIEAVFDAFQADNPGVEWYFGNVYADDGETPLGWWE